MHPSMHQASIKNRTVEKCLMPLCHEISEVVNITTVQCLDLHKGCPCYSLSLPLLQTVMYNSINSWPFDFSLIPSPIISVAILAVLLLDLAGFSHFQL